MRLVLVLVALAALAFSAAVAAPAAVPSAAGQCPRVSGPAVGLSARTLDHYVIGAHGGVTCAFARTWAVRILHEQVPAGSLATPTGPPGWTCLARARGGIAFNGSCRDGARSLSWGAI